MSWLGAWGGGVMGAQGGAGGGGLFIRVPGVGGVFRLAVWLSFMVP